MGWSIGSSSWQRLHSWLEVMPSIITSKRNALDEVIQLSIYLT